MVQLPPHHAHALPRKWRLTVMMIIPALLMGIGLTTILFPQAIMWFSQYEMSQITAQYNKVIENVRPDAHEQIRRAREYNAKLQSGAIYEANTNIPTTHGHTSDKGMDYWTQLKADDNGLMARLQIKKIDLDLPVYHGTSDETLLKGLGHLRGTSLPVGGAGTRAVITGHRGLASAEMFTRLDEIKEGDTFTIAVFSEVLTYKVRDKIVVEPDETKAIEPELGKDLVTLVTCTPLGINSHRILVTGERIYPTPKADIDAANKPPTVPRFPWWAVIYGGGLILILLYLWWAGTPAAPRKKKTEPKNLKPEETGHTNAETKADENEAKENVSGESGADESSTAELVPSAATEASAEYNLPI